MKKLFKSTKSRLSFVLERNPKVEKSRMDFRKFVPYPYDGVVMISADFELAWAWRFDKLNNDPVNNSLVLARKERKNIPKLIELSERYHIPVTWGTVGHLFLNECKSTAPGPHPELDRLSHFENEWWKFDKGDWFAHDPCSSQESDPEWYAPDLIKLILASKVGNEIAGHTFSHINCSDDTCPANVLEGELKASQKAAAVFGLELESFIFPGHTMGNYNTIRKVGYSSMRTNFINVLGYPHLHPNGLWEHKTTMELCYNDLFSVKHNIKRYMIVIEKCIKKHQVCNFWFHPSFADINIESILPRIYNILGSNRKNLWITTMNEYTKWLNNR